MRRSVCLVGFVLGVAACGDQVGSGQGGGSGGTAGGGGSGGAGGSAASCQPSVEVSAGGFHSCAVSASNTVVCWGFNDRGQSNPPGGSCTSIDAQTPCSAASGSGSYQHVSSGSRHTCAIDFEGRAVCWGENGEGQSVPPGGTCDTTGAPAGVCIQARGTTPYAEISAGAYHTCAIRVSDGLVDCWGDQVMGQANPPTDVAFQEVSAGYYHTCGITVAGQLRCWGTDTDGQIPANETATFAAVSAGFHHTCAVDIQGVTTCWGDDGEGQSSPVPGLYSTVATGANHSCGRVEDSSLQCWGSGTTVAACTFADGWQCGQSAPPNDTFAAVVAGDLHTCGVTCDGVVLCWGLGDTVTNCAASGACGQAIVPTNQL